MKTMPSIELRKQQKALVLSTLQVSENVNSPEKSENASEVSELHHNGIVPPISPVNRLRSSNRAQAATLSEVPPVPPVSPVERPRSSIRAQATTQSEIPPVPPVSPVKRPRSSIRAQATTQSEIPESWRQRSKDQQSHPLKRSISASFGTVETRKKPKPTTTKTKGSRKGRSNKPWTADEKRTASEARSKGKSWEYIADLLGRPVRGCKAKLSQVPITWVPRRADVKLMWSLVIEQKIVSGSAILKYFPDANSVGLIEFFSKIKRGSPLTSIPTVPDDFFARIRGVKDERFEHKDVRGIVYPRKSSEAFEYRWIDGQLVIIDAANLLINVKPLLVWYPFIDKFWFIKPRCYAVVEEKTSKRFAGEWVSLLSAFKLYVLSGHWNDDFQDLVLFNKDGERRQTHKDMVRVFKDDEGKIMCSLCNLAFTSEDSYHLHAALHEYGWPHIRYCCLSIVPQVHPKTRTQHDCPHYQEAKVDLFGNRPIHGTFDNLLNFQDDLNHSNTISHDWDLIAYSVRWSSDGYKSLKYRFDENIEDLVKAYETSYAPTSGRVIKSPFTTRSSRCPIFTTPKDRGKLGRLNNFFRQIYETKPQSRILIMSQSLDGLTTNLQSLVFFARSMEHLRITLGFCLSQPNKLANFGHEVKDGKGWTFYNLQILRANITGLDNNLRYIRLITALFIIQKHKQG